jgi:hypothetical protein
LGIEKVSDLRTGGPYQPVDPPAGGGNNSGMEHRLTALETKIETILPTLATKADVADAKSNIVQWVAGIGFAIVAIIVSVMAFMLNRALPPQSAAATPPIVINVPAQQSAPVAPAPKP